MQDCLACDETVGCVDGSLGDNPIHHEFIACSGAGC